MPLLQHACGLLLRKQQQQHEETQAKEPFEQQRLTFLPAVQQHVSNATESKSNILEKSFAEGGVAALHRTHKAAVSLRLQVFCDAFQVYKHLVPVLLLEHFAAAAAPGVALGLGSSLASIAASAQSGAFTTLTLADRMQRQQQQQQLQQHQKQQRFEFENDTAAHEALVGAASEASQILRGRLQQQSEREHQQQQATGKAAGVLGITSALIDVFVGASVTIAPVAATAGQIQFQRKLTEAAAAACSLLLQSNCVCAADGTA